MRLSKRQWAIIAVGVVVFIIAAVIALQHPGCDIYADYYGGYCMRFGGGPDDDLAWVAWLFGIAVLAIAVIVALVVGDKSRDS